MPTKNDILADLLAGLPGIKINSASEISDPILAIVRKELEDDDLLKDLKAITSPDTKLSASPYGFEYILSDTTSLIHRCMDKRTDLKNLEVALLNDTVSRILSEKQKGYEKGIRDVEEAYPELAGLLAKQTSLVNNGNEIKGDDASINKVNEFEGKVKQINSEFRNDKESLEKMVLDFKEDNNSGLNYLARYIELKEIYWNDMKELFGKLRVLEVALYDLYSIESKLPQIEKGTNLLNECYIWLKKNLQLLNGMLEYEEEYSVVISLRNGIILGPGSMVLLQHPDDDNTIEPKNVDWSRFMKADYFYFYAMLSGQNLRIRNIGAKIVFNGRYHTESMQGATDYWALSISPPFDVVTVSDKPRKNEKFYNPSVSLICSTTEEFSYDAGTKKVNMNGKTGARFELWVNKKSVRGYPMDHFGADNPIIQDIYISFKITAVNTDIKKFRVSKESEKSGERRKPLDPDRV